MKGKAATRMSVLPRVLAVALPLVIGLCVAGWLARGGEGRSPRSGAAAPATVLHMGEVTLRVPNAYLFGSAGHDGPHPDGIAFEIQVLLPDMEPETPANATEFRKLGWGRILFAAVYYKGLSLTGKKLFDVMMDTADRVVEGRKHVTGTDRVGPFTVTRQQFSMDNQVMFTGTRDKPGYFAECDTLTDASPGCERTILIAPNIYVSYAFSRSYLNDYAGIERRLLALLNSFRIHGQPFTVIQ